MTATLPVSSAAAAPASAVERLADAFERATLPATDWHHRAHLGVAMVLLRRHGHDDGLDRLRAGIRRLNRAHGVPESPTRGYHETITRFWVHVVWRFLERAAPGTSLDALEARLWEVAGNRELPLVHWSRERLFSVEARGWWVEPDVCGLD
jgi:hypothetical protein